jgi:type I restriction enzyme R subunit
LAKEIAAAHGVLPSGNPNFDDVLTALRRRSALPRQAADMFYHLKKVGNRAVHEDAGTTADALTALKFARSLAVWFYQSYRNKPQFKAGPFIPPTPPEVITEHLEREMLALRKEVTTSRDAEAQARLAAADADAARVRAEGGGTARGRAPLLGAICLRDQIQNAGRRSSDQAIAGAISCGACCPA